MEARLSAVGGGRLCFLVFPKPTFLASILEPAVNALHTILYACMYLPNLSILRDVVVVQDVQHVHSPKIYNGVSSIY